LGIAAALAPGLLLTGVYALFPGALVKMIFGGAYGNPGVVLALANLSATLYAGIYIWLNYALSLDRPAFVYALIFIVLVQASVMFLFGRDSLLRLMLALIFAALLGHCAGFMTLWAPSEARARQLGELVASEQ